MNKSTKFMNKQDWLVMGIILTLLCGFAIGGYIQTRKERNGYYKKEVMYAWIQTPQNCRFNWPRIDELDITHGRVLPRP